MKFKLLVIAPVALTIIIFFPTLSFDFAWLDITEILGGKLIIDDWWRTFFINDSNAASYHRPLYNAIHTLDYHLWGEDPYGYHLSNLILQVVNVSLLFFFLGKMGVDRLGSLAMTTMWAVLPALVPVVALIHAKADLLSTMFLLSAGLLFLNQKRKLNILVFILLVLALFSKEVAVGGILFLGFYSKMSGSRWKELWPLMASLLVYLVIKIIAITSSYEAGLEFNINRLLTFPLVYGSYFFESLPGFRTGISDTVYAWNGREAWPLIKDGLFLIAAIGLQWFAWKKLPHARPFILLFNLLLLPVSQIIPTLHFRADRFLYLASVGWIGIWGYIIQSVLQKPWLIWSLWFVVCGWFGYRSYTQLPIYENSDTLFESVLEQTPVNREARAFMGQKMLEEKDYSAAIFHLTRALNGNPKLYSFVDRRNAKANLGTAKLNVGQYEDCIRVYSNLSEEYGSPPEYDFNWSLCYKLLGRSQEAYDRMVRYQRKYPDDITAMEKMAEIYVDLGKKRRAIDELNKVLKARPNHRYKDEINRAIEQLQTSR